MTPSNPSASVLRLLESRWPRHWDLAQRLFNNDEIFRSMCEDLAAAVEALAKADLLPRDVREVRRQEYGSLVEALLEEIGDALLRSKVVSLRRPTDRAP